MRKQSPYQIFYAVPPLFAFLALLSVLFLWKQYDLLRASYLDEKQEEFEFQCRIASNVLASYLASGEMDMVRSFCQSYSKTPRHLTLITEQGDVLADSAKPTESPAVLPAVLENHLSRPEVQRAILSDAPACEICFSETTDEWRYYYALPIHVGGEAYILRASIPLGFFSSMRSYVAWCILFSIFSGAGLSALIMCYIIYKICVPLGKLRESAVRIAGGDLSGAVFVPKNGITRELALAVAEMTKQHRERIGELTVIESFRSEFVANVSHEIKTPLTGILSSVEMLEDGAKDIPEMRDRCLNILAHQSQRLHSLVLDILSLAKLEQKAKTQTSKSDFATVTPQIIFQSAVAACSEVARENEIELVVNCGENPTFSGDLQLLEQAVTNLIINAIRYSGTTKIEIQSLLRNEAVLLTVRDFGIGIPEEHLGRIFERFYRVHKERSRELGGTGLGLAIVKHIVQLHGGQVSVHSELGKGAEFQMLFPVRTIS